MNKDELVGEVREEGEELQEAVVHKLDAGQGGGDSGPTMTNKGQVHVLEQGEGKEEEVVVEEEEERGGGGGGGGGEGRLNGVGGAGCGKRSTKKMKRSERKKKEMEEVKKEGEGIKRGISCITSK